MYMIVLDVFELDASLGPSCIHACVYSVLVADGNWCLALRSVFGWLEQLKCWSCSLQFLLPFA